jgi:hypothetical protein
MRRMITIGALGLVALSGCASVGDGVASMQPQSSLSEAPSVRMGTARLLDAHIDPMAGVRVAAEADVIVVHYANPGGEGFADRLDPSSLQTLSHTSSRADPSLQSQGVQRIALDDARTVLYWKAGDAERGYRAMAQAFNAADGSPRGAPEIFSPSGADVIGPVSAVRSGNRIIATFAASSGDSFAAYAVPIEAL